MSKILHGGDYNPEQWLKYPGVIDEDFRLFRRARINSISIGIFSWAALEPEEGRYEFGWMDDIFERAARQEMRIILATPSGGKPNWLARGYPEVRRVTAQGVREPQKARHNHCLTSPIYRGKVDAINTRLAERYGRHPALSYWHLSNEYGGYCYCDLCVAAFQNWLRGKYVTLDAVNEAYWARFWSHTYGAWDEIQPVDESIGGLALDWRRFMTHQCRTFIHAEAEPIHRLSPGVPVTTNFMHFAKDYNYWELASELDVISWDSYPMWHTESTALLASNPAPVHAFSHDHFRTMGGGKPFLLMETTPSQINWQDVSPLRRPGVHRLSALQAVAHGADSVCYFQLRKSRGSCEQFHGAVIDHVGHGDTRVFREVAALGEALEKIANVAGATVPARAAIIFDWECWWAYEQTPTPQNRERHYVESVLAYYRPLWKRGIAVDIIHAGSSLEGYDLVLAPVLFMLSRETGKRLSAFVERGGTLVSSYGTGIVDELGLAVSGGVPGHLRETLGVWVEEFDGLPEPLRRTVAPTTEGAAGLSGNYEARHYLDLLHAEGAETLATYQDDFYAGRPALTRHRFGRGDAYYVASRNDDRFLDDFLGFLVERTKLPRALDTIPPGISAEVRVKDGQQFLFVLNFTDRPMSVNVGKLPYRDAESGEEIAGELSLSPYGSRVLVTAV